MVPTVRCLASQVLIFRESIFRASIFQVPTSRTTACLPRISQSRISRIICFRTSRAACNEVVRLVNEERAKAGLPALTVDRGAASAAQVRAKEIERSFSHTRPDGSSFNSALTEAGVNFSGAGENIAYGQNSPEKVMEGWMNSSGHRANILNSSYTSIGVGHYQNTSGVNYWTQLFIR